ncbi:MAG: NotI family restriction endonuclease [Chloroflexota bacterium]|nr:NotI family restriction endonuclease [Chloroflexota bacterium]
MTAHYPAEVFGFPVENRGDKAESARQKHHCPFINAMCNKRSRLISYPMGVCSAHINGHAVAICPRRFLEGQTVFRDIALDYFGSTNDLLLFSEVRLKGIGSLDYVLVRHKPMSSEIEDFVVIELQTDQTTGTGKLVQALEDFMNGKDVTTSHYPFGMNTYDTLKRSYIQMLNKGVAMEHWSQRIYWVFQEYVFDNLVQRYQPTFSSDSSETNVFAIYDLVQGAGTYALTLQRFVSASVDALFAALRQNPNIPDKDQFVAKLQTKVERGKANLHLTFTP